MTDTNGKRPNPNLARTGLRRLAFAVFAVLFFVPANMAAADDQADPGLWAALRAGGHVALMRHAIAPGTGDPADFALGDCATQRNLSEAGHAQAERIGARLRANGITQANIFTSQWCRCRDTATRLGIGSVTALPALNSFFRRAGNAEPQTRAVKAWLASRDLDQPHILVTHQVNITALTGIYPRSGEIVVIRLTPTGDVIVAGRIATE